MQSTFAILIHIGRVHCIAMSKWLSFNFHWRFIVFHAIGTHTQLRKHKQGETDGGLC